MYPPNPFSPRGFAGVNPPKSTTIYKDRPYTYIYNPPNGELTGNQVLQDEVSIETDSDFNLEAWYISDFTGTFTVQLTDSTGYQLQSGEIQSAGLSQSGADPTVFSPAHPFPAGGKIRINITDTSGTTNPLQIAFVGTKRFRVPQQ